MSDYNFDGMTREQLMEFWARYHVPSRRDAAALIGDKRKGYVRFTEMLAAYACNKAVAMGCRADGNVASAEVYEKHCDNIFDQLPADLRW